MSALNSRKGSRYNSLTDIDSKDILVPGTPSFIHSATPARERRKFVSFTVELLREGGPLGNTPTRFLKIRIISIKKISKSAKNK